MGQANEKLGRIVPRDRIWMPDRSLTIESELALSPFQLGRSRSETFHFQNVRLPLASVKALSGPVTARRQAVMSMEQFGKRRRRLVADPACNPCDGLVACFEQKGRFRHPAFDHITVHGLADELGEASRKYRAAEPHAVAEVAKSPGPLRVFVDQLERRSDMRVRYRPKPAALSGTERRDPASEQPRQRALLSVVRARRVGRDAQAPTRSPCVAELLRANHRPRSASAEAQAEVIPAHCRTRAATR
jgi:hypothetical protein